LSGAWAIDGALAMKRKQTFVGRWYVSSDALTAVPRDLSDLATWGTLDGADTFLRYPERILHLQLNTLAFSACNRVLVDLVSTDRIRVSGEQTVIDDARHYVYCPEETDGASQLELIYAY
jgi:hypothetical protein